MDSVTLDGMEFFGHHGVRPEERSLGQRFTVAVTVWRDLRDAGRTDRLEDTVNYADLYRLVRDVLEGPPMALLEAVAETIAQRALAELPVEEARVSVTKPTPPIHGAVGVRATVTVQRRRGG